MSSWELWQAISQHAPTRVRMLVRLHHVSVSEMCCVIPVVMGGLKWKSNVLMTAFFVPGCVQGTCFSE